MKIKDAPRGVWNQSPHLPGTLEWEDFTVHRESRFWILNHKRIAFGIEYDTLLGAQSAAEYLHDLSKLRSDLCENCWGGFLEMVKNIEAVRFRDKQLEKGKNQ